jgi:hypothetical protein
MSTPPLLRIPPEIHLQILSYLTPHTTTSTQLSFRTEPLTPTWHRSRNLSSILLTNHALYTAALSAIYASNNVFVLGVTFKGLMFQIRYSVPDSKMTPLATFDFPGVFGLRAAGMLSNVVILVERPDEYSGRLKYNCGGRELVAGIKRQVARLVRILDSTIPSKGAEGNRQDEKKRFASISVHFDSSCSSRPVKEGAVQRRRLSIGSSGAMAMGRIRRAMEFSGEDEKERIAHQHILAPLGALRARNISVGGDGVASAFAKQLERRIRGDEGEDVGKEDLWEEEGGGNVAPGTLEDRIRRGEMMAPLLASLPAG